MSEDLDFLLKLYKEETDKFIKANNGRITITIELTPEFLKTCESRIIEGHSKYGDDWRYKDNLKERDAETFDYFNYTILDACKKRMI
jgi:hypothetical protein